MRSMMDDLRCRSGQRPSRADQEVRSDAPAVTSLSMRGTGGGAAPPPLRVRILWPALGFPAVVSPRNNVTDSPFMGGDATRCITVLLLSNRRSLSKADAAKCLRCVPWSARGRRHIPAGQTGSFRDVDLVVRNDEQGPRLVVPHPKDRLGELLSFGGGASGERAIVANLGKRVREFYRQAGLQYLHEIRVYESATNRFADGLYHLFWNNGTANESAPSDEMALLLTQFARPRRSALGRLWQTQGPYLIGEYEYEYGNLHLPYCANVGARRIRAEILHPLFIQRQLRTVLRVGQLSDTHADVRADVYQANLEPNVSSYNNWNTSFVQTYNDAKRDSDVLLLTGDLVDYGRGHWGPTEKKGLGEDSLYHVDRNWFLFQYLLASGNAYIRPVYTILGNHDWRLNPYPPFAIAGAPKAGALFHSTLGMSDAAVDAALRRAHGDRGHEPTISYNRAVNHKYRIGAGNVVRLLGQWFHKAFGGAKTMDVPGMPTETTVESVAWYLMSINPFLDYAFTLSSGHSILMLDWAEDESVFLGDIFQGKRYGSLDKRSGDEGPKAKNCLTDLQVALTTAFTGAPGKAKIIGMHAPPIAPWYDWHDDELFAGWKPFDIKGRGYPFYERTMADGRKMKGHPLFAIAPAKGVVPGAVHGMDASYNSFERNRSWFIKHVAEPRRGVRLVLAGHIHRRGLFVVHQAPALFGPAVAGELLIKAVNEKDTRGVRYPAGAQVPVPGPSNAPVPPPGPLYVNSTSVGPRGHISPTKGVHGYVHPGYAHLELANDGTIQQVLFRWVQPRVVSAPVQANCGTPARVPVPASVGAP